MVSRQTRGRPSGPGRRASAGPARRSPRPPTGRRRPVCPEASRLAHPDQVVHRVRGGHVGLVRLRDRARERGEQRAAPGAHPACARPRRRDPRPTSVPRRPAWPPGAAASASAKPVPGSARTTTCSRASADSPTVALYSTVTPCSASRRISWARSRTARGVPVPGQVHHAGHVPAVDVLAQEQPGLPAGAQVQHAERDRGQLLRRDLEQFLARVALQDLGQVLAVVAVRVAPGRAQERWPACGAAPGSG